MNFVETKIMSELSHHTVELGYEFCEKMLNCLGGRKSWAEAQYIFYRDRLYTLLLTEEVQSQIWRGLEEPCEHAILTGQTVNRTWAWNAKGGAGIREGEPYKFSTERMESEHAFWPIHTFTMIHRIAKNDPSLLFSVEAESTLMIHDAQSGNKLGQILLNHEFAPVIWRASSHLDNIEIIYGPVHDFGQMCMPRWGAMMDGVYRFEYIEMQLSIEPPPVQFEIIETA